MANPTDGLRSLRILAEQTYDRLVGRYGKAACTLDGHEEPWHLMVGAILAAQCTDARVNKVTPALFERYPLISDFAGADRLELEDNIRSCGLFRMKARSIQGSAAALLERFDGQVPADLESLLTLPGIGRKIANLIMGDGFGIPGVVVDTHCGRISKRIGLTDSDQPARVERDLRNLFPPDQWIALGHLMVAHGRDLCPARNPHCERCPLSDICRHAAGISA